jgi:hypothetical protein
MFVYFLLNKFYTQDYIAKWWLCNKLNFSLFLKLSFFYYYLKFKALYFLHSSEACHGYSVGYVDLTCILSYEMCLAPKIFNDLVKYFTTTFYFKGNSITRYITRNYFNLNDVRPLVLGFYFKEFIPFICALGELQLKLILYFYDFHDALVKIGLFLISQLNVNAYAWYVSVLLKLKFQAHVNCAQLIRLFNNSNNKIKLLSKAFLFKFSSSLKSRLNLNNFILYKFYIKALLKYYLNILFKIKNKMVYYKSNYYNYRKVHNLDRSRKHKINIGRSFLNVRTRRGYNSFYNLTFNTFFLKNLYSFNLNTYIYLLSSYNVELSAGLLFSPFIFLKYNFSNYILFVYWFIYVVFFIFIYIFYEKFFYLFFFSKKIKQSVNVNTKHS